MSRQQRKLKRLLSLTAVLLESRVPLSARQLRNRMLDEDAYSHDRSDAAFRRTFERDKRDLASIGVPIAARQFEYGDPSVFHYSVDRAVYAERDLGFTPDELAALRLATLRVRLPGAADAFIKTGIPTREEIASLEVAGDGVSPEMAGLLVDLPFDADVSVLASAAAKGRVVEYAYCSALGVESQREVEPWGISFTRGHWYLVGWDVNRKGKRIYRVDRIRSQITEIGKSARSVGDRCDLDGMNAWDFGGGESFEVSVLVDADLAVWAAQAMGVEGRFREDGSAVLTLEVRNKSAFRSFVFSMLDHAEVIKPRWLRDEIVEYLRALAAEEPSRGGIRRDQAVKSRWAQRPARRQHRG